MFLDYTLRYAIWQNHILRKCRAFLSILLITLNMLKTSQIQHCKGSIEDQSDGVIFVCLFVCLFFLFLFLFCFCFVLFCLFVCCFFFFAFQRFEYHISAEHDENLNSPNLVKISSWWPDIWPPEYLISSTEISVNLPGS